MKILFSRVDADECYEVEDMKFLPQKGNFIFFDAICYKIINTKFVIEDNVNTDVVIYMELTTQKHYMKKIGFLKSIKIRKNGK